MATKPPGFQSIESKSVLAGQAQDDRLLMRQARTQPGKLSQRFVLASGIITILETDFTASGLAYLTRIASAESELFPSPGYLPAVRVYKLNFASVGAANALTVMPSSEFSGATGALSRWYDAKVIKSGNSDEGQRLSVRITVRSIVDDTDALYYYFVDDGAPEGLLST